MLVKDLIYLLNTRCKPDDEVVFMDIIPGKEDDCTVIRGTSSNDITDVWREVTVSKNDPNIETEAFALINVGDEFGMNYFEVAFKQMKALEKEVETAVLK